MKRYKITYGKGIHFCFMFVPGQDEKDAEQNFYKKNDRCMIIEIKEVERI